MFDFIVNVQVAVVRDGKYLFIVRGAEERFLPGAKGLPGGKEVEHCESSDSILEETGAREVLEETGVTVASDPVYVRSSTFTANGKYVVNVVFMAQWKSGEPYAKSPGEVSDCLWISAHGVAVDTGIPEWEQLSVRKAERIRLDMGW